MMTGTGNGHFAWMIIIWVFILGSSIWLLVVLFPRQPVDRADKENVPEESALAILQRRYARGELTRREYEAIRSDLEKA
jgi:putative membrane protein